MKAYTTDQLFDLLATVSCHKDVIEVNHYILTYHEHYSTLDLTLLLRSINILHNVFIMHSKNIGNGI